MCLCFNSDTVCLKKATFKRKHSHPCQTSVHLTEGEERGKIARKSNTTRKQTTNYLSDCIWPYAAAKQSKHCLDSRLACRIRVLPASKSLKRREVSGIRKSFSALPQVRAGQTRQGQNRIEQLWTCIYMYTGC